MTKNKRQALEDKLQGNVRFHEFKRYWLTFCSKTGSIDMNGK